LPYTSSTWYSTSDNLLGSAVVSDGTDDSVEWSKDFSSDDFDRFLFASGDFTIWLQALKTEVNPGVTYNKSDDPPKNVINSSIKASTYTSDWNNTNLLTGPAIYVD